MAGGTLWFSNFDDNLVYRRTSDGAIGPVTRAGSNLGVPQGE